MQSFIYNLVVNFRRLFFSRMSILHGISGTSTHGRSMKSVIILSITGTRRSRRLTKSLRQIPRDSPIFAATSLMVEWRSYTDGVARLRRKVNCTGFLPDLEAINRGV